MITSIISHKCNKKKQKKQHKIIGKKKWFWDGDLEGWMKESNE